MGIAEGFWYGWPWMGLGMAAAMVVLLFGTDLLRGAPGPRWRDPIWLAWCAMPAYLVHQFEEYALHITGGQYDIVTQVFSAGIFDLSNLTMAHFPYVNIALVWVAVPVAAILGKRLRNPAVALAPYGFILANGFLHFAMTVVRGVPADANPGFFTGTFLFLPLAALVIFACVRGDFMDGRGLAVTFVSGVMGHVLLAGAYAMAPAGPAAVIAFDTLACFSPLILAWLGCRAFKAKVGMPTS